jgi:hypothetical protein
MSKHTFVYIYIYMYISMNIGVSLLASEATPAPTAGVVGAGITTAALWVLADTDASLLGMFKDMWICIYVYV